MLLPEINGSSMEIGRNSALCFSRRGLATPLPASLAEAGWGRSLLEGRTDQSQQPQERRSITTTRSSLL